MRRGELWTVSGGPGYAGKPRPAVIVQDDAFGEVGSITVCPLTTDEADAPIFRIPVEQSERTGLRQPSRIMVDKISTVPRSKLGKRIGHLDDQELLRLGRALIVFLGLAGSASVRSHK